MATGPGHAVVLSSGRIVVPFNRQLRNAQVTQQVSMTEDPIANKHLDVSNVSFTITNGDAPQVGDTRARIRIRIRVRMRTRVRIRIRVRVWLRMGASTTRLPGPLTHGAALQETYTGELVNHKGIYGAPQYVFKARHTRHPHATWRWRQGSSCQDRVDTVCGARVHRLQQCFPLRFC